MSKLNVHFNIFSNLSSSIDQDVDVKSNNSSTTGVKRADDNQKQQQTQPHEQKQQQNLSDKDATATKSTSDVSEQPTNSTAASHSHNEDGKTNQKLTSPGHRTTYHFHLPGHKASSMSPPPQPSLDGGATSSATTATAEATATNVLNIVQSTHSSTPTLQQPQPQSSRSQQKPQYQQHSSGSSPTRDEKFHKLVKKTINKLKLSPAVPTVAPLSPDSLDSKRQQLPPQELQLHSQQSTNQGQSPSQGQYQHHHHHLSTPLTRSRYNSVASCNSSSSDIFERSVTNGNPLSNFANPETPFHHNIENYTSPILDTTAEILVNPNIQLEQVKLNCYCDDDITSLPSCDSFKGRDSYFSPNYNNGNGGGTDKCSNVDCKSKPNNQSTLSLSSAPAPIPGSNVISPTLRPRARSIISQLIISTLDNSKHSNSNNTSTTSGNSHLTKVKSSTATTGLSRPHLSNLRSSSFAGNTSLLRNKSNHDLASSATNTTNAGKSVIITRQSSPRLASLVTRSQSGANLATSPTSNNSSTKAKSTATEAKYVHSPSNNQHQSTNQPPVIDFYSFADMCTHEDEELAQGVAEEDKGKEKYGGNGSTDDDDDDNDDDDEGIDPLDETNIQEFGFNSISSSGSGMISGRDGSISTGGTMFTRDVPLRRGSYATINAKDYIGVL